MNDSIGDLGCRAVSRRRFLGIATRGLMGVGALGCGAFLATPAAAIAPAVALLIAQTAISVVRLFSHGDDGIGSLMRLQVEMLMQISQQLEAIQAGVLEILNRLDQVEALIGRIPEQVVVELYRAKIAGLNGRYDELMATYKRDVDSNGIAYAQSNNAAELESELLKPLREARDVLMTYHSFGLVPILCSASFVETHAMIMANYRKSRKLEAIGRYQQWLSSVSDGTDESTLAGAISSQLTKQKKDKSDFLTQGSYECLVSRRDWGRGAGACFDTPAHWITGQFRDVTVKKSLNYSIDPTIDATVAEIVKSGVLPADERPAKIALEFVDGAAQDYASCNQGVRIPQGKQSDWIMSLWQHPCDASSAAMTNSAVAPSQQLTDEGLRLMSLHSLKNAADEGRSFLRKMSKAINHA